MKLQQQRAEKWKSKERTEAVERYDERLINYRAIMDKMDANPNYHSINCVQLVLGPLLVGIKTHAKEWLTIFGSLLEEMAKTKLNTMLAYIKVWLMIASDRCTHDIILIFHDRKYK